MSESYHSPTCNLQPATCNFPRLQGETDLVKCGRGERLRNGAGFDPLVWSRSSGGKLVVVWTLDSNSTKANHMKKTKAVFLDVGWTLIYPRESVWEMYAIVTSEAGSTISAADVERFVHMLAQSSREQAIADLKQDARYTDSDEEFVELFRATGRAIFKMAGFSDDYDSLNDRFLELFWSADNWAIFPEVFDALEQLRARRLCLGVLSNAASDLTGFLDSLGLLKWFDFAVVSAAEGMKKPDRRIFERALGLAEVEASEAVHVGDMFVEDILGARRLGMRSLLMDRGENGMFPSFPEAAGHPPGSIEVVRNLHDVVAALDAH